MDVIFKPSSTAGTVALICHEGEILTGVAETVNGELGGALAKAATSARFTGKDGQIVDVLGLSSEKYSRILLVGAGEADKADARIWEKVGGGTVKKVLTSGETEIDVVGAPNADAAARILLGAKLAAYRFDDYREVKEDQQPTLTSVGVVVDDAAAATAAAEQLDSQAFGSALARDLVNTPPNDLYPEAYANKIQDLSELGLEIDVLNEAEMEKLGMAALLGVGQGSEHHSRMVVMKWMGADDKKAAPLALVGKGVTFDTGGISLKPGAGMEDMKGDMGGSAAVVGAMATLAKRKAKANVVGLVGLVENMPDGKAQRPGDVVKSASGKTIEILNTDAEGRLVLCDVLWYAQDKFKPKAVIDLATLTGAIIIALGHEHAGVFSNDDDLSDSILAAGETAGEPAWRLPVGSAYDKLIDSKIADMKNIGGRGAGSITAAQFLQRFIEEGTPWAHIDIAGTAWKPSNGNPLEPSWASGYGVRLLDQLVADKYED